MSYALLQLSGPCLGVCGGTRSNPPALATGTSQPPGELSSSLLSGPRVESRLGFQGCDSDEAENIWLVAMVVVVVVVMDVGKS